MTLLIVGIGLLVAIASFLVVSILTWSVAIGLMLAPFLGFGAGCLLLVILIEADHRKPLR